MKQSYQADAIVVGGGIAGMIAAFELLNANKKVLLIDRDTEQNLGGLARWSFGGMFFVDTPHQRRLGIADSTDLAMRDWLATADFDEGEVWGRRWAEQFIYSTTPQVYEWLKGHGLGFFPVVHWVERGQYQPGNSVPRFHLLWGTGWELVEVFKEKIKNHPRRSQLQMIFGHRVTEILTQNDQIRGVVGVDETTPTAPFFEAMAPVVVVATGGINGSIERVKQHWHKDWRTPPETLLNGSHYYAVGDLHDATARIAGSVVHLDKQWNYAAGIRHYAPRMPEHGLSLVPCKSAIWTNHEGKRFNPPLVTSFDTRDLVQRICQEPVQYSWQVLNLKIAYKEFAISGSEHNDALRNKNLFEFLKTIVLGNKKLVHKIIDRCEDVVTGNSLEELAEKMNALTGNEAVKVQFLKESVEPYDAQIERGKAFHNDDQLRRIAHARLYRGDKARTAKFQKILDPKAFPLLAIREFILSRKSLGGIQTNLDSQVLTRPDGNGNQKAIEGLYAVGEAAGFGGGGMHGLRSLEGTFLTGCILTARVAARHIAK